jgi:hypothetical protein
MNPSENIKFVTMLAPLEQTRGVSTSESLDTAGYSEAIVVLCHGSGTADFQGFELQESVDNAAFTAISEATVGNAACVGIDGTTIDLDPDLGVDTILAFQIDLKKRKRYLRAYIRNSIGIERYAVWALLGMPSNMGTINNAKMVLSEGSGTETYVQIPLR